MDEVFNQSTELVYIRNLTQQQDDICRAARLLKSGHLVAFPTETVYGIGALGLDRETVQRLYEAKNRPTGKAFSLQVANVQMIQQIAACVPLMARELLAKFAPGPITVILPKSADVPDLATGGRDTVGIRIPNNPVALALLEAVGEPLAVPSANISGHASPKTGTDVYGDMAGRLAMILDAGPCVIGRESTIVDCTGTRPVIVRHGAISDEDIFNAVTQLI